MNVVKKKEKWRVGIDKYLSSFVTIWRIGYTKDYRSTIIGLNGGKNVLKTKFWKYF